MFFMLLVSGPEHAQSKTRFAEDILPEERHLQFKIHVALKCNSMMLLSNMHISESVFCCVICAHVDYQFWFCLSAVWNSTVENLIKIVAIDTISIYEFSYVHCIK